MTFTNFLLSSSPRRAATLVRKTKGENKMGRNHPLRCGRQRWYGGNQGMGTRGELAKITAAAPPTRSEPHQDTTLGTPPPHPSPPPTTLLSLTSCQVVPVVYSSCSGGLTCACLCWTQQSDQCNGLNCMTWVQREGAAKDNKTTKTLQQCVSGEYMCWRTGVDHYKLWLTCKGLWNFS